MSEMHLFAIYLVVIKLTKKSCAPRMLLDVSTLKVLHHVSYPCYVEHSA